MYHSVLFWPTWANVYWTSLILIEHIFPVFCALNVLPYLLYMHIPHAVIPTFFHITSKLIQIKITVLFVTVIPPLATSTAVTARMHPWITTAVHRILYINVIPQWILFTSTKFGAWTFWYAGFRIRVFRTWWRILTSSTILF